MNRTLFLLALAATVLLVGWLVGCSSDDDKGTDSNLQVGDTNDVSFQFVQDEVFGEEMYNGVNFSMELSSYLAATLSGGSGPRQLISDQAQNADDLEISSYSYAYGNGWHVFTIAGVAYVYESYPPDTIDFSGIDSVMILDDGDVQMAPDDSTDEIRYRAHLDLAARSGNLTRDAAHNVIMTLVPTNLDLVEVNGTLQEAITAQASDTDWECDLNLTSALTASHIQLDLSSDGCPEAGSLVAVVVLNADCTGQGGGSLNIDGTWTATGTFNGVTETYVVTHGNYQWTVVDTCYIDGGAPRFGWDNAE
jgi:hypothetical protein